MTGRHDQGRLRPPAVIADIDVAWLDGALRDGGFVVAEVESIEVEPLAADAGFLGDLARVSIRYRSGSGPDSVIVKLPASAPGARRVGTALGAWPREVAFYRDVAPVSPGARVPRCYHAAGEPSTGRWVVVLEACPADEVDTERGAEPHQADAAVDALASFHAVWWGASRRFEWMPGFDTTGVGGLAPLWSESIPVFLARYEATVPAAGAELLRMSSQWLPTWSDRVAAEPLTMVHADYRLDNLVFDGGRVTIIDWQTALRGPAAMDLTSFIATGLTVVDRRGSESRLIGRYLDGLAQRGVAVDGAWFEQSFDENLLWWMGQYANNLAHLDTGGGAAQLALDTMVERTFAAALDRDVGRLLA